MERIRTRSPVYSSQKSISNSSAAAAPPGAPSSPMMSPMHRHVRTASAGGAAVSRRQQNSATRAAMQRLAKVMAHQSTSEAGSSDDEDDDALIPVVEHSTPRRSQRSPSPAVLGRYLAEQTSNVLSASAARPSMAVKTSATLIPSIKPSSRGLSATLPSESILSNRREKRISVDLGTLNTRDTVPPRSSSALQDEIDVLQEGNENIIEKLRIAEEKYEEAEARVKQLEKQNASNAAVQTHQAMNEEISALRFVTKKANNEAASKAELHDGESEIRSLRTAAQRMMLTQEEMEEVVLKRCWLARYWKLCVQHDILADIAEDKYEYWSSFAPLPLEVVLSAGQKARDNCSTVDSEEDKLSWDINDVPGEGNIESLLLVEKGLKELASLKVEEAVLVAMAQHRNANVRLGQSFSGPLLQSEGQNHTDTFELSQEESGDVLFKQAWLTYFWRRAKNHGLEEDIADERLQFWINQSTHSPTLQDAVDVERGLFELKRLGIEFRLWKAIREESYPDHIQHQRFQTESEL